MDSHIQTLYKMFEGFKFTECNGCSKCCFFPWLLQEEYDKHLKKFGKSVKEIKSVAFIQDFSKCKFAKECRCAIYPDRPLDCRLFPLDIIEEDGKYYWCIFTICPKHSEIGKKLLALIPTLEKGISRTMWEQYKRQISITKKLWLPYRLKQYRKVKLFQNHN